MVCKLQQQQHPPKITSTTVAKEKKKTKKKKLKLLHLLWWIYVTFLTKFQRNSKKNLEFTMDTIVRNLFNLNLFRIQQENSQTNHL